MEKKGGIKIFIIIAILVVATLIIWQLVTLPINKRNAELNKEDANESANITQGQTANEELEEINETIPDEILETNQTANETIPESEFPETVSDPTGKITAIDRRDEEIGRYFCNDQDNPRHKIRVYAYKIIEGIKTLSENYIESNEINVCETYSINESKEGIYYYIEWQWSPAEIKDGYRIFQSYSAENVSRDYDYYVDIKTERLIDSKLGLWTSNSSA